MRIWAISAAFLALSACATEGETVYLRNQAGAEVHCGPYSYAGGAEAERAGQSLRNCVEDFQKGGYRRVQK